jgi:hypothetical protein
LVPSEGTVEPVEVKVSNAIACNTLLRQIAHGGKNDIMLCAGKTAGKEAVGATGGPIFNAMASRLVWRELYRR